MSSDVTLTIEEVSRLYKTSPGAIRTALWRYRHESIDPGIPIPGKVRGRYRWLRSAVEAHLNQLTSSAGSDSAKP